MGLMICLLLLISCAFWEVEGWGVDTSPCKKGKQKNERSPDCSSSATEEYQAFGFFIMVYSRGSGPKVGAIFFRWETIFWSHQKSEKNRQRMNKERLFYWQLNNHPPPWAPFSDWSGASGKGRIKIWQSSRHVESLLTCCGDCHFLLFCHWFLEGSSQK